MPPDSMVERMHRGASEPAGSAEGDVLTDVPFVGPKTRTKVPRRVADAAAFDRDTTLVPMKTSGSGRPLFLMHPPSGVPWVYGPLLDASRISRPVYVTRAADLSADHQEVLGIAAMVDRYVADICRVQPHGPYSIGGYSFGGQLAFEVASRLVRAGHRVEHLIMFDVPAPATGVRWWKLLRKRATLGVLRRVCYMGRAGHYVLTWSRVTSPLDRALLLFGCPAPVSAADLRALIRLSFPACAASGSLRRLSFDDLCDTLVEQFRKLAPEGQWERERRRAMSQRPAALVKAFKIWAKNDWLALRYSTKVVLPNTITVYASHAGRRAAEEWQKHTTEPLVLRDVPAVRVGGRSVHVSFLDTENLRLFAEDFGRLFDACH